ncbi:MAG TPA: TIGR02206 family membrane protein [Solirubrobacterales bacterium]|nr:TIGR02206 family membrane protein [Solirubrobacterales bacterium]
MSGDPEGLILSTDHVAALAVTAAACVALPLAARRRPGAWTSWARRGLALFLVGWLVADQLYRIERGTYSIDTNLPLELTNAVTLIAAIALWTERQLAFELTYFWGLTASLQATLTPGLRADEDFPGFYYWHYFAVHSGAVVAAVLLAFGLGMTPRRGAVWRVFAITVAWTALVAVANLITGGNYMYLRERPATSSLLDALGPWPLYVFATGLVGLAMFALLDLPFRRRRARA